VKISVIGAGNVATHLIPKLDKHGHQIVQVFNRKITKARKLARQVGATAHKEYSELNKKIDLLLIIVSDDAISTVAENLKKHLKRSSIVVAHTSGSTSSKVLKDFKNFGVFYPLQSFRMVEEKDWDNIPVLVNANTIANKKKIEKLAQSLSLNSFRKSDSQRKSIHLSAVILNNFINHLFCLNSEWLENSKSDFSLLIPLIQKTIENAQKEDPCNIQTGPAKRNDQTTIKKHLSSLKEFPELYSIYSIFSANITKKYL